MEVSVGRTEELGAKGPGGVVTAGPWNVRDSFVAETAVALDRLAAKVERLERREEALKAQVGELLDHAQQTYRFQALAESLRNSRDYKLDEMVRLVKDVRARVEAVEGPRAEFSGLTYKSLVAVDRKLAELAATDAREARLASRLLASNVAVGVLAAALLAVGGSVFL
jgi:phage shock protein A